MARESRNFAYDVFLSFRGEDTRQAFTGYLHRELEQKGINTFTDDDDILLTGESISSAISKAIEESKVSIIVLSKNYASSRLCLDELVMILDSRERNNKQLVFPVFYHVDPSDVRFQRNSYGEAMTAHEIRFGENSQKVQTWRSALSEICQLKGLHISTTGFEINYIEVIVQEVYDYVKSLHVGQDQVEIEHSKEEERLKKEEEEKEDKEKEKEEDDLNTIIKVLSSCFSRFEYPIFICLDICVPCPFIISCDRI